MNFKTPFKVLTTAALIGTLAVSAVAPGVASAASETKVSQKATANFAIDKLVFTKEGSAPIVMTYAEYEDAYLIATINNEDFASKLNGYKVSYVVTGNQNVYDYTAFEDAYLIASLENDKTTSSAVLEELASKPEGTTTLPADAKEGTFGEDGKLVAGEPVAEDFKVTEIAAINAKQVEFKFSKEVAKEDAEDEANYSIGTATATDAVLGKDGKTVTATFVASIEGTNAAVVVEPITVKADDNQKTARYAQPLTYKDTVKPTVTKIESVTGSDEATTATVTFSEPVSAIGAVKLNGKALTETDDYTLSADGYTLNIFGQNMDATQEQTLELVNFKDFAGNGTTTTNVTDYESKTFKPTVDKAAPTVTSVEAKSDSAVVFTFSKAVDLDGETASDYIAFIDKDLVDQTTEVIGSSTFEEVDGSDGTQYTVAVDKTGFSNKSPFAAAADKTAEYTVKFIDKTIADLQGNKLAQTTKQVTFKRDEVAPKVTNASFRTNTDGEVKELTFTFDEDVTFSGTVGTVGQNLTVLLQDKSINTENSVAGTLTQAFGSTLPTGKYTVDGNKVIFTLDTAKPLSGKYELTVDASKVKDKSIAENSNKASKVTIDFGAAKAGETFEVSNVVATKAVPASNTDNVIKVTFDTPVKGGSGEGSATLLSSYKLNGKALPEGTTIVLDSDQKIATITLPEGTVATSDEKAVFVADGIASKDGNKKLVKYTTTVDVVDNVAPVLKSVKLTPDNNLLVEFSEDVTPDIADLDITINDITVDNSLALNPATGSDAGTGKYSINLKDLIGTSGTSPVKTVLNLTGTSTADIEIANSDVTSTFKYATNSKITSIKVKVIGQATVDAEGNKLTKDTVITVK